MTTMKRIMKDFDIDWILWGNNDTAITPTVSGMENENNDGDMRRSNNHKECTDNVSNNFNDAVNRENPNQDQREIPWTGEDLLNLIEDMEQSLKLSKMIGMESPSIFLLITSC